MINEKKISICIPIYNVEKYIGRCAKSALEQTYNNMEYVFVDDCSTDNSVVVLKNIVNLFPTKRDCIKIIVHDSNKGVAAARNTALNNITGDYVVWMDSDDYIDKDLIKKLMAHNSECKYDIVVSGYYKLFSEKKQIFLPRHINSPQDCTIAILKRQMGNGNTLVATLFKSSILKENYLRCIEGCNYGEDMFLKLRCFFYAKSVSYLDEALYYYDCTRTNSLTSYHNKINQDYISKAWLQMEKNKEFFMNKGDQYIKALQNYEFLLSTEMLFRCAHFKDSLCFIRSLYIDHIDLLPSNLWSLIPMLKRFPKYVRNEYALFLYFNLMSWVKHRFMNKGKR